MPSLLGATSGRGIGSTSLLRPSSGSSATTTHLPLAAPCATPGRAPGHPAGCPPKRGRSPEIPTGGRRSAARYRPARARPCRPGPPFSTELTSAPTGLSSLKLSAIRGDLLDHHPDPPRCTRPCAFSWLWDLHRHIDRDANGRPHETACLAVDLGVDADHLALQVEQRPAGLPG